MLKDLNPIGVAVPFFFLLIAIEAFVLWRQARPVRVNDAVTDMSCGMGDQILDIFVKGITLGLYALCHEHWALFDLSTDSAWTWVLGMLGVVSLGFYIQEARAKLYYDEMLLLIGLGALIVLASDLASSLARRSLRARV